MRGPWLSIVFVVVAATTARANTRVVVMTDPDDAAAMQVALAGRGAEIAALPAPEGALRLDRAAVVQRSAVDTRAIAGVWIEQEPGSAEVCVVSADGHVFRHAPLPIDAAVLNRTRIFAAIATSLLDELLVPPPAAPTVNVDVHVEIAPPVAAVAIPALAATPIVAPGVTAVLQLPAAGAAVRADRTLFEIGPMLTPASFGLELGLAFPLGPQWRFAVNGIANILLFDDHSPLWGADVELRHIGLGTRHFDVGLGGGAATAENDPVGFAALRLGMTWEGPSRGFNLSLVPTLVFTGSSGTPLVPAAFASARWELAI